MLTRVPPPSARLRRWTALVAAFATTFVGLALIAPPTASATADPRVLSVSASYGSAPYIGQWVPSAGTTLNFSGSMNVLPIGSENGCGTLYEALDARADGVSSYTIPERVPGNEPRPGPHPVCQVYVNGNGGQTVVTVKTGAVAAAPAVSISGLVDGRAVKDKQLSVSPTNANYVYGWEVNGVLESTSSSYTPTLDSGTLRLIVFENRPRIQFVQSAAASQPAFVSAPLAPSDFNDFTVSVDGTGKAGETLTASVGAISPSPAATDYRWTVTGSSTARSTSSTFTPGLEDVGRTVTLEVTAVGSAGVPPNKTRSATRAVQNGAGFSGTKKVGNTLTAFGPAAGTFSTFANTACTTDPVVVGVSPAMLPPAAAGRYVRLTKGAQNGTCEGPIAEGTFDSFTVSAYSGTPRVAETMTATDPSGLPNGATVAYSWTIDGNEVSTDKTYTPVQANAGKTLRLTQTVTLSGYTTKVLTSAPVSVAKGNFNAGAFSLTDSTPGTAPTTADVLTAVTDASKVPSDTVVTYQWGHLGSGQQAQTCLPMAPAVTTSTYTVANRDAGKTLCVVFSATAEGYNDGLVTVHANAPALGTFTSPTITFDVAPQVDLTSKPVLTGLDPTDAVTYSYVWKVDGEQVAATQSYTPTQADAGKAITVTVTSAKTSYMSDTTSSASGVKVKKGVFVGVPLPLITGTAQVGQTLTRTSVQPPSRPTGISIAYSWGLQRVGESDCLAIGSSSTTLTLARLARGQQVCVLATYSAPGYNTKTFTSALVGPIDGAQLTVWRPAIDETAPRIGDTLTATVSTEGYPEDAEVTFTWGFKSVDEEAEEGADNITCQLGQVTGSTYEVTTADAGRELCVVAAVEAFGFNPGAAVSRFTTAVPLLPMDDLAVSVDDATPTFGDTLAAVVSGAPEGATVTYSWGVRAVEPGDEPVVTCDTDGGATTVDLAVGLGLIGEQLCVTIAASAPGYEDTSVTSDFTAKVEKATMADLSLVLSDTTPTFEDELTATVSGAPTGATTTWLWGRVVVGTEGSECVVAEGAAPASTSTYVVVAGDVGFPLCVTAMVSADGFDDATATAESEKVAGKQFEQTSVTGGDEPTVGTESTLVGTALPTADTVSYAWEVDGVSVADVASYTPAPADAGDSYEWTVTFTRAGYDTATVTGTGEVAKGTFVAPEVALDSTPTVGQPVEALTDLGGLPEGAAVSWQWFLDGEGDPEAITGATGATYTPVPSDVGSEVHAVATFTAPGYEDATGPSDRGTVVKGTFEAPAVELDSTPTVGQPVEALTDLGGLPEGIAVSWQWFLDGEGDPEAITGATGATYTPVPSDLGGEVHAVATFTAPGYEDATASSDRGVVAPGTFEAPEVTVSPSPAVGTASTATTDLTGLPDGIAVSWQWFVTEEEADSPIAEATSATYVPSAEDAGRTIYLVGTFTAPGYTDATARTPATEVALGEITAPQKPTFAGKAALPRPLVGRSILAALPATATKLPAGAEIAWRFTTAAPGSACRPSGAPVTGPTARYTPTVKDLGRRLCAEATITAPGYETVVVANTTGLVTEPGRLTLDDSTIVGRQKVTVNAFGLTPGKAYTVLALQKPGGYVIRLTGIAPADGRVTRSFRYPSEIQTRTPRIVRVTQPTGYAEKITLDYTRGR